MNQFFKANLLIKLKRFPRNFYEETSFLSEKCCFKYIKSPIAKRFETIIAKGNMAIGFQQRLNAKPDLLKNLEKIEVIDTFFLHIFCRYNLEGKFDVTSINA